MTKTIKIISLLVIFILCSCQARIGTIEVLDNLKVSDISGICIKKCDTIGYLTENDETGVITELKKIKSSNLISSSSTNFDTEYFIVVETNNNKYEIHLFDTNNIVINQKRYSIDESIVKTICDIIDKATYLEK